MLTDERYVPIYVGIIKAIIYTIYISLMYFRLFITWIQPVNTN